MTSKHRKVGMVIILTIQKRKLRPRVLSNKPKLENGVDLIAQQEHLATGHPASCILLALMGHHSRR